MLRVILVDQIAERAALLRRSLEQQGFEVIAVLTSSAEILDRIDILAPDVILADMQSPDRDTIEDVKFVMQKRPCPVVMYAGQEDSGTISRAIEAGVSAYVTDDIGERDLGTLLDLAAARFKQFQSMQDEIRTARSQLEERRNFDRAKALLIRHHQLAEESAHRALQQMAMNQRVSLSEAADNVIAMYSALETRPAPRRGKQA